MTQILIRVQLVMGAVALALASAQHGWAEPRYDAEKSVLAPETSFPKKATTATQAVSSQTHPISQEKILLDFAEGIRGKAVRE